MASPLTRCPNGHPLDPGVRFCRVCGASLTPLTDETALSVPQTPLAPVAPPVYPPSTQVQPPIVPTQQPASLPPAPQPKHDSNRAIYAIAGAVIFLGIIAIAVALVMGSGNNNQKPPETVSGGTTPTTGATTGANTPSPSSSPSASANAGPDGGKVCGSANGIAFGTIGSMTSCDFAGAVYQAYVSSGNTQGQPISATSPVTHKDYTNIVCTPAGQWVTCVGGNNNTARVFFAAQ